MFYILDELVFNGESLPDEVRKKISHKENKYNDKNEQYLK